MAVLARFWCALASFLHPCSLCCLPCSGSWTTPPPSAACPNSATLLSILGPAPLSILSISLEMMGLMGLTRRETRRSRGLSDGAPTLPGELHGRSVISVGYCRVREAWGRGSEKATPFFFRFLLFRQTDKHGTGMANRGRAGGLPGPIMANHSAEAALAAGGLMSWEPGPGS